MRTIKFDSELLPPTTPPGAHAFHLLFGLLLALWHVAGSCHCGRLFFAPRIRLAGIDTTGNAPLLAEWARTVSRAHFDHLSHVTGLPRLLRIKAGMDLPHVGPEFRARVIPSRELLLCDPASLLENGCAHRRRQELDEIPGTRFALSPSG